MKLLGSCHCGAVRFALESHEACPYMRCYCSICRKTAGGGGYAINLGGDHRTMEVEGREHLGVYSARMADGSTSPAQRNFCKQCGSGLWVWDPRWPDLVHPHASAIDSELPMPPRSTHIMLGSKAGWVAVQAGTDDERFDEYPTESLAQWHERMGLSK